MNAVVIDDEIFNIKNLEWYLDEDFPEITVLRTFTNIADANDFILRNSIDLVFLDIEMPNGDGFDLLNLFPERSFQVIFITAYEEYALKAIKAGATDYILKPILREELQLAIEKATKIHEQNNVYKTNAKICLQNTEGKYYIEPEEILYIQGIDNISKVYLTQNRKIILSKSLKYFEELLLDSFYRIHKSYIINLNVCKQIDHSSLVLTLENEVKLPISRRNYKSFKEKMIQSL